jgi:hypothetical protein
MKRCSFRRAFEAKNKWREAQCEQLKLKTRPEKIG